MSLLIDGFTTGLGISIWLLGVITAAALTFGCAAAGLLLITNAYDTLTDSRPAWRYRARRSTRRAQR